MSKHLGEAVSLYKTFHQLEPRKIGEFDPAFRIPALGTHVGHATEMLYRSDKLNPETGKDEGCLDYIHEHGPKRVRVYRFGPHARGRLKLIPRWLREREELVLVGGCLGFSYRAFGDNIVEARTSEPYPEWYATRCGLALLIVSDKRDLEAVLVGGGLRVTRRGVVG